MMNQTKIITLFALFFLITLNVISTKKTHPKTKGITKCFIACWHADNDTRDNEIKCFEEAWNTSCSNSPNDSARFLGSVKCYDDSTETDAFTACIQEVEDANDDCAKLPKE